jgi:hypothetical protein
MSRAQHGTVANGTSCPVSADAPHTEKIGSEEAIEAPWV